MLVVPRRRVDRVGWRRYVLNMDVITIWRCPFSGLSDFYKRNFALASHDTQVLKCYIVRLLIPLATYVLRLERCLSKIFFLGSFNSRLGFPRETARPKELLGLDEG